MPTKEPHYLNCCALCENRNDLRQECCCTTSEEELIKVVEVRLLKRCHLLMGDRVCAKHYHKLKSGLIFGGKERCCAPFHVGALPGKLLRPVPRIWRQYFDSTDVISRYHPSLQLCADCYRVTIDIMLLSDHDVPRYDIANDVTASPDSTYTSPRSWRSSRSINGLETNSGSGSTWSLATPRGSQRSKINLLERYTAQKDKCRYPRAVPESVKRYFHSYPNFINSSKSHLQNNEVFDSDADNKDLSTAEDKRNQFRRSSSAVMRLQTTPTSPKETRMCSKLNDVNDTKCSKIEVSMSPKNEDKLKVSRAVRRLSSNSSSTSLSSQETYKSDKESTQNEVENDLTGTVALENIASASDMLNTNPESSKNKTKTVKTTSFASPFTENKEKEIVDLSNAITSNVISSAIRFQKEANSKKRIDEFSKKMAEDIVDFVTQKNKTNSDVNAAKLEYFSSQLTETILSKAKSTMMELNACEVCANKIINHCFEIVSYVNVTVEDIIKTAFETYQLQKSKLKSKREDLAETIVKEILAATLLEYNAGLRHYDDVIPRDQNKEKGETQEIPKCPKEIDTKLMNDVTTQSHVTKDDGSGTTRITWLGNKKKYRSVLTVHIPRYDVIRCPPVQPRIFKSERAISVTSLRDHDTKCSLEVVYPLKRSISLNFGEEIFPEVAPMRRTKSLDSFFLVVLKPDDVTYSEINDVTTDTNSSHQCDNPSRVGETTKSISVATSNQITSSVATSNQITSSVSTLKQSTSSVSTSSTEIEISQNKQSGDKSEYFSAKYSVESDSDSSAFENISEENASVNFAEDSTEPVNSIVSFQDDNGCPGLNQNQSEDIKLEIEDVNVDNTATEVDISTYKKEDTVNEPQPNIFPLEDVNQEEDNFNTTERDESYPLFKHSKNKTSGTTNPHTNETTQVRIRKKASQLDLEIDLSSLREEIAKLEQLPSPEGKSSFDSEDEDEKIHQRRRTQLIRAATETEIVRNKKLPTTLSTTQEKEEPVHPGESEDEDVSDVLAKAFERITPNMFMTSQSQASDNKIRILTLFGVSSIVLFAALFLFM